MNVRKYCKKAHRRQPRINLAPPIHDGEFAMMQQCPVNEFYIVLYKPFFGDDRYTIRINDIADAGEMFNMINMAGVTAEELENLGFTI
jgi:hypothetical protein